MIKGIVFDFDNTLYNYDLCNDFALKSVIDDISVKFNIDITNIKNTYEKINKQIKRENNSNNKFNKSIYFKQLFEILKIPLRVLNNYISLYNSKFMENFKLYNGVIELFCLLKSKNIAIGILSNNIFMQQYLKLEDSNLIEYIDTIITSDECGEEKPSKYMFLLLQNKIKIPFENLAYVGDNYEHDIIPCIEYGILPFWFNTSHNFKVINNIIHFNCFNSILLFFNRYFDTIEELIFLSKYFGQSILNTQGPGGNISVKLDNLNFIKSSGCILGNITYDNGYCVVNNDECKKMVLNNTNKISESKIYGYKMPSMETYFHSFMKKYTVHLHFVLSNIYQCSSNIFNLHNFKYNYKVIDYHIPGIEIANEIYKCYNESCDIYFLKNHGIIITGESIDTIMYYYEYCFNYFNKLNNNIYDDDYFCFLLNKIYYNNKFNVVIKKIDMSIEIFKNIKFCFPDMIVFIKNIIEIENIEKIIQNFINYDIILYNNNVYCISENITNLYSLIEILEAYKILYIKNEGLLETIKNLSEIRNMPEEKYRNSLLK